MVVYERLTACFPVVLTAWFLFLYERLTACSLVVLTAWCPVVYERLTAWFLVVYERLTACFLVVLTACFLVVVPGEHDATAHEVPLVAAGSEGVPHPTAVEHLAVVCRGEVSR